MNTKTILSLFLCLSISTSYCSFLPTSTLKLHFCWRTCSLFGSGAGTALLTEKIVQFRLDELARHKATQNERAWLKAFRKKENEEKEKYQAYWNEIQEWKKRNRGDGNPGES